MSVALYSAAVDILPALHNYPVQYIIYTDWNVTDIIPKGMVSIDTYPNLQKIISR